VEIDGKSYADGGMILNLPVQLFPDTSERTLHLWIKGQDTSQEVGKEKSLSHTEIATQCFKAMYYSQNTLLELWFGATHSCDFVLLPPFFNTCLPVPLQDIDEPIHIGLHTMLLHLLKYNLSVNESERQRLYSLFCLHFLIWKKFWCWILWIFVILVLEKVMI
jgi:hypothetical protein